MNEPDIPNDLLARVRALLANDKRTISKLCSDLNGSGLGYHWLRKMKKGDIQNPGAERVVKLYTALSHAR